MNKLILSLVILTDFTDSSRAPCLTSGLQGSVNVHRGAIFLVPQWQYISSFVLYIYLIFVYNLQYLEVF